MRFNASSISLLMLSGMDDKSIAGALPVVWVVSAVDGELLKKMLPLAFAGRAKNDNTAMIAPVNNLKQNGFTRNPLIADR